LPFVYILRCADNTYYVGHTDDLQTRLAIHNLGTGAEYTAGRRPVTLVYSEVYSTLTEALERERQLKRWSGKKKEALIGGHLPKLRNLSKRRTR
jgi:predicted GIY-YIG superfamily endonuclease